MLRSALTAAALFVCYAAHTDANPSGMSDKDMRSHIEAQGWLTACRQLAKKLKGREIDFGADPATWIDRTFVNEDAQERTYKICWLPIGAVTTQCL